MQMQMKNDKKGKGKKNEKNSNPKRDKAARTWTSCRSANQCLQEATIPHFPGG
jgi:hypothetical protein